MISLIPVKTPEHIEWLRVQRSRPELYKYFRQDKPITKENQALWWKNLDKTRVRLFIVQNENNESIGYVGFNPFLRAGSKAEFGMFVIPEFQDRGYGKEAIMELLRIGFEDYKLSTIYSDVLNYKDEDRFSFYKTIGFEQFPQEHQYISYLKDGKRIQSIKFFMTNDIWPEIYGKYKEILFQNRVKEEKPVIIENPAVDMPVKRKRGRPRKYPLPLNKMETAGKVA